MYVHSYLEPLPSYAVFISIAAWGLRGPEMTSPVDSATAFTLLDFIHSVIKFEGRNVTESHNYSSGFA
jgi:hypothetical protein